MTRTVIVPDHISRTDLKPPETTAASCVLSGDTMGTQWTLSCYRPAGLSEDKIRNTCVSIFDQIICELSNWEPNSTINKFNRAPAGTPVQFSDASLFVIRAALELAALTDGSFNPCLGRLAGALEFATDTGGGAFKPAPTQAADWTKLVVPGSQDPLVQPGGVQLDLSAIAKGYAIDLVCERLKQMGVDSALLGIGGDYRGYGCQPGGQPWWVEITTTNEDKIVVALCGHALATSGTGHRRLRLGEDVFQHIVPLKANNPSEPHLRAVSVVHTNAMMADAWATALFALDDDQAQTLSRQNNIGAFFQFENGATNTTPRMDAMLT